MGWLGVLALAAPSLPPALFVFLFARSRAACTCTTRSFVPRRAGLPFDRHWAIVDGDGNALVASGVPALKALNVRLEPQGLGTGEVPSSCPDAKLVVSAGGKDEGELDVYLNPESQPPLAKRPRVTVCVDGWHGQAADEGDVAARWLQRVLQIPDVRLVRYIGSMKQSAPSSEDWQPTRRLSDPQWAPPQTECAFSAGFPISVANLQSLEDAARRAGENVPVSRLGHNVIITGDPPFREDTWLRVGVGGGVELVLCKPYAVEDEGEESPASVSPSETHEGSQPSAKGAKERAAVELPFDVAGTFAPDLGVQRSASRSFSLVATAAPSASGASAFDLRLGSATSGGARSSDLSSAASIEYAASSEGYAILPVEIDRQRPCSATGAASGIAAYFSLADQEALWPRVSSSASAATSARSAGSTKTKHPEPHATLPQVLRTFRLGSHVGFLNPPQFQTQPFCGWLCSFAGTGKKPYIPGAPRLTGTIRVGDEARVVLRRMRAPLPGRLPEEPRPPLLDGSRILKTAWIFALIICALALRSSFVRALVF